MDLIWSYLTSSHNPMHAVASIPSCGNPFHYYEYVSKIKYQKVVVQYIHAYRTIVSIDTTTKR